MLRAVGRNAALVCGLVVAATIGGAMAKLLDSPRGEYGPAVITAESIPRAVLGVLIVLAASTAVAIVVGRICNTVVGLFVLGGGLFGLAWRLTTIAELARAGEGSPALGWLSLETIVWAALVLGATLLVFRLSGPLADVEPLEPGEEPHPLFSRPALKAAAAGALVLPVVWVVAQSSTKGQVLGAVFCGAMVAGLAGRLLSPHVQPVLLFASPILFGAIGQIIGAVMIKGPLPEAFVADTIKPISLPMPIDYAAGSLMGAAVGIGWARSFLHHEEEEDGVEAPAVRIRSAPSNR